MIGALDQQQSSEAGPGPHGGELRGDGVEAPISPSMEGAFLSHLNPPFRWPSLTFMDFNSTEMEQAVGTMAFLLAIEGREHKQHWKKALQEHPNVCWTWQMQER